ncbi:MAG TPA: recombinase family protein [Mollicutes bacterium]|nr:recombinase family protein [Mollicutes bacterium]
MNIMYDNLLRTVKILYIIIYARLSKEEKDKQSTEEQSQSIKHQFEICREYIEEEQKEYPDCSFIIVEELYDDGISGTTFDRADFNKLVKLIENKQANMVITKDLSRLGRDHIETDNYIEKWFPEHNVRYVSILESVDTYDTDNVSNDIAPLINWSNDQFAKTTSKKIRKEFKKMMHQGKWVGGEPPLGYIQNPKDKYHFIIEPIGAEIVKRIFKLALEEKTSEEISDILIADKVPIPTIIKGNKRDLNVELKDLWSSYTISDILRNKTYLGHMVQGKTTKLNYKSKKIIYLPEEDWIVVKNMHEPIIKESDFNSVQLLIKSNKNTTTNTHDYLLKGIIKCKECHHSIGIQHFNKRNNNYTICSYYRKYGSKKEVCTAHRFQYEELEKLVIKSIKKECMQFVDSTNFADKLKDKEQSKQLITDLKLNIDKSNRKISKIEKQIDTIYEDKLNGVIDDEQYKRMVINKQDDIIFEKSKLEQYQKDLESITAKKNVEPNYNKKVKDFLAMKKPNKKIIGKLIEKIELSEDGTIDIHYKVQNPYKNI